MKKSKLLIPILGIAAATGVITPIVVSCNKNEVKKEIDVAEKSIVTTKSDSAKFEFIWNSYKAGDVLDITQMYGYIGDWGGWTKVQFSVALSTRELIETELTNSGKSKTSIPLDLTEYPEADVEFIITYKVNDGEEKEVEIRRILVTYKPQ